MSTALPPQTPANDALIKGIPYNQLTDRQKQYADKYGLTLQPASPAPPKGGWMHPGDGPFTTPGQVVPPNLTDNVPRPIAPPLPIATGADSTSGTGAAPDSTAAADKANAERNAYTTLLGMFSDYGLESLGPTILKLIQQGYDATSISYLLKQTPEYKARFAGNDGRVKNGLAPLSPAEYLATERAYRQALSSAGLPQSFYDNHADFTEYIAADKSPAEIKQRADQAMQFVNDSDPSYIKAFQNYYGAGPAEIAAYMLDGQRNEALLTKQITASQIGQAATVQGLAAPGRLQAERYVDNGVTQSQAQQGFQNVAAVLPDEAKIASRFGQQYTQQDAQDEFLGGLASAQRKRKQLNDSEEALFAGSSGLDQNSLKTNAAGSY